MKSQVISKKRIADHGEVLTAKREVNAMLDLVKQETERIDSRFLEPACGNGNFLTAILERKLAVEFSHQLSRSQIGKEFESTGQTPWITAHLVGGAHDRKESAERYATYLRTRFVRFLVSLRKATQDAAKDVYAFVPDIPLSCEWTNEKLYKRYGITKDEIAFIESMVRPMPAGADNADREVSDE